MIKDILLTAIAVASGYLLGSIPPAYIIGRLKKGIDIREVGSRNLGAMNVFYNVGFWYGIIVLVADIGKGALAVILARLIGAPLLGQMLAGVVSVLGHSFTIFLKFRGGKGGATCIGVLLAFMPWGAPFYLAVFGLTMLLTHFPTLSYSLAFAAFFGVAIFLYHSWQFLAFSIALLLIPVIRYIPRVFEMKTKGGSWGHVVVRKSLKDRL